MTVHSPGWSPYTHVETEIGPVPGMTRSIVSSCVKVSSGFGSARIPTRLPVNLTVAAYGSPSVPGSNQWVITSACGSPVSSAAACVPAGCPVVAVCFVSDSRIARGCCFEVVLALLAAAAALRLADLFSNPPSLLKTPGNR